MGTPPAGSVVLVPFPFSDLSQSKLRPAVVLAHAGRGDWILCQVTSRSYADPCAVEITDQDFNHGSLRVASYARPAKLFTAHQGLFIAAPGELKANVLQFIIEGVVSLLKRKA